MVSKRFRLALRRSRTAGGPVTPTPATHLSQWKSADSSLARQRERLDPSLPVGRAVRSCRPAGVTPGRRSAGDDGSSGLGGCEERRGHRAAVSPGRQTAASPGWRAHPSRRATRRSPCRGGAEVGGVTAPIGQHCGSEGLAPPSSDPEACERAIRPSRAPAQGAPRFESTRTPGGSLLNPRAVAEASYEPSFHSAAVIPVASPGHLFRRGKRARTPPRNYQDLSEQSPAAGRARSLRPTPTDSFADLWARDRFYALVLVMRPECFGAPFCGTLVSQRLVDE
jgi:hypothetical protein